MFELLVVVIVVLALVAALLVGASRRATGDPSSSVDDFHRAMSAMEPGARSRAGKAGRRAPASDADEGSPEAADERDGGHGSAQR